MHFPRHAILCFQFHNHGLPWVKGASALKKGETKTTLVKTRTTNLITTPFIRASNAGGLALLFAGLLQAATIYTPYTFTTFAGTAGVLGTNDGTGSMAQFYGPQGITTDSGGNVYVADSGHSTIRKITPAGVVTTLAGAGGSGSADGTGSSARFSFPTGVAADSSNNVYVADSGNNIIRKITPEGVVTTLAGSALNPPGSTDGTGSAAQFSEPFGVATDSSNNVYVADTSNNTIRKITPDGVVTTFAGSPGAYGSVNGTGSAARFAIPFGIATDSSNNLYVACKGDDEIRKITPARVVTTLAGHFANGSSDGPGSTAIFQQPSGLATDSSGNVYVADTVNDTVRKITPAGLVTTLAGLAGTHGSADGTGSAARFFAPFGIATDASGNVYVVDTQNNTIRKGVPGPVPSFLAATYRGLFYENDEVRHAHSGYFSFKVGTTSVFNGTILIEGGSYTFTGTFDANSAATSMVARTDGKTTLTISLQLTNSGGNYQVTGTVTDGIWTSPLLGDRAYYTATTLAPQAGKYTIEFLGNSNGDTSPSYGSAGVVTISASGAVALSGTMSDTAAIAETTALAKSGQWPLYVKLYGGVGSLLGWVTFDSQPAYKLTANVSWIKTGAYGPYYTQGFTNALSLYGGSGRHP